MSEEFEIVREAELRATPEEVWDAFTSGTGGWLWPMEYEPREGGAAPGGGTVTVWEPPHRFTARMEGEDGWFNQLEYVIEGRDGGLTSYRYVHSGVFTDDWDNQYDGASRHTDFYLHTLAQYLRYFSRRPVAYAAAQGPAASSASDAFTVLRHALGLDEASQGDSVQLALPGIEPLDAVVDYLDPYFIGLRTDDALYRFFGRNAFGAPVGIALHLFGEKADRDEAEHAWQSWLDGVFAQHP
ncbi:SRPBCC family protein [Peterkaempfera bronchialis]|uniref:SRPBCC domain-containing protein n=1 Tax=Peterkaempfera bronchialis TaxID=2126346 RepID=A0A345T4C3_9ACTN|nr:SRPBCC domain-containing protein [Peterkaempfera bronchialis]AXI80828.1 SRPBCC domain-containing protein [Peterkaempfera bronchialis]